ncbi:bleomycin resistance protein [Yersinia entomophaga]|uniref:Bleomycin resistance protein n=1 Tax=Yersinia entomophaga TaxID=935293 RepID=A0ABM6BJ31_YERET|nr:MULTISPECIES: VOC family protein [Yersinia]ANI29348.1 bleomycin resistance protein [Yersinia entomophaga]OWF88323.1 glyoxalase/bleomycin resistance/extradiol dioxygenase family protein [Yersinia entomophaga]
MAVSGKKGQIDNIEFIVGDITRSKNFYGNLFGWRFTDYGPTYCEFTDGRLTGGFTTDGVVTAAGGPLVILYADNLEETERRVVEAGGVMVKPIFSFPGGRRFQFLDPDGYQLAVWSAE